MKIITLQNATNKQEFVRDAEANEEATKEG
jgi:hypothetical protein